MVDRQEWQRLSGMTNIVRDVKECQGWQRPSGMAETVRDVKECQGWQRPSGLEKSVKEGKEPKPIRFLTYIYDARKGMSYIKAYLLFKT